MRVSILTDISYDEIKFDKLWKIVKLIYKFHIQLMFHKKTEGSQIYKLVNSGLQNAQRMITFGHAYSDT